MKTAQVSNSIQNALAYRYRLRSQEDANEASISWEAVMTEADQFRQYAKEAECSASETTSENEKRDLLDLALTWAQAALMSERVLGSTFISSPRDVGEATPLLHS